MDYFKEVYLKDLNRFGNNIQNRVHGQMENDFEYKLKKSVNRVDLFSDKETQNKLGEGILSTKSIDVDKVINYLMTRVRDDYKNGSVVYTAAPASNDDRIGWMVFFKELYQTIGYNRYQVILLDRMVEWIVDGIIYRSPCHFVGEMDESIKKQFKIVYDAAALQPIREVQLVIPYHEKMRRGIKIEIEDTTWNVRHFDRESIPGVMYVTLEEDYDQGMDLSAHEDLKKWTILSNQGTEIVGKAGQPIVVSFQATFDGEPREQQFIVTSGGNSEISTIDNKTFTITGKNDTITVSLKDCLQVYTTIPVIYTATNPNWIAIVGPSQIKVDQTVEFELNSSLTNGKVSVQSEKGNFVVDHIDGNKVYLKGTKIGKDNIVVVYNWTSYPTPVEIISPWM